MLVIPDYLKNGRLIMNSLDSFISFPILDKCKNVLRTCERFQEFFKNACKPRMFEAITLKFKEYANPVYFFAAALVKAYWQKARSLKILLRIAARRFMSCINKQSRNLAI